MKCCIYICAPAVKPIHDAQISQFVKWRWFVKFNESQTFSRLGEVGFN